MIKEMSIRNFKLFNEVIDLPLSKINLFTGKNGQGKSTVLQVFLVLSQSPIQNRTTRQVILNGNYVNLGSFDDIKNSGLSSHIDSVNFGFKYDKFSIKYILNKDEIDNSVINIDQILVEGDFDKGKRSFEIQRSEHLYEVIEKNTEETSKSESALFNLFISNSLLKEKDFYKEISNELNLTKVHYISADRMGPKTYYLNKSLSEFITVGALGEDTVNVLFKKGDDLVNVELLKRYASYFEEDHAELGKTVLDNTNYWLDKIFQGTQIKVEPIKGEDLLKLRISSEEGSGYYKPTNVGYGFSYSLPIIVAGLISKPGEIIIVENPEAHLHPYAQSILAKFLSFICTIGVQVLIESHSEHILNGLRVSKHDAIIPNDDLKILYFDSSFKNKFVQIPVDSNGGIDDWPKNFFDQATNDLNYLYGI